MIKNLEQINWDFFKIYDIVESINIAKSKDFVFGSQS
mgnify:CR=1 FL=1